MKNILFFFLFYVLINGCSKDSYLDDGGVQTPNTSLSAYDYLAGNAYHYFDTVLLIVDHFNLKDSVNRAGTFFAPTNFSVNRVMTNYKIPTLDSLYKRVTSKFITQFLFSDTSITLTNATSNVKIYKNWADTIAGITELPQTYRSVTTVFTYYTLQYVKINGYPDGSGAPSNDPQDLFFSCQTTDIKTVNGNTLNVLANTAVPSLK